VDPLRIVARGFRERIRSPRAWTWLAFDAPRMGLALLLALVPCIVLVGIVLAWPQIGRAVTDPKNVHDNFGRFLPAIATASAIAISAATLTLRRDMHGLDREVQEAEHTAAFRERLRDASGLPTLPLSIAAMLATAVGSIEERTASAKRSAPPDALARTIDGVRLGDYLDLLETRARETRAGEIESSSTPHRVAVAIVDFEHELSEALARRFARAEVLPEATREAMAGIAASLRRLFVLAKYAKNLDLTWGISRMTTAILVTAFPAVAICALMVLAYGSGLVDAWGMTRAVLLVAGALFIVMLPLTMFVSHTLRFVFFNEHTLAAEGIVLGPEEMDIVEWELGQRPRGQSPRSRPW
jgi:hypothetical protein